MNIKLALLTCAVTFTCSTAFAKSEPRITRVKKNDAKRKIATVEPEFSFLQALNPAQLEVLRRVKVSLANFKFNLKNPMETVDEPLEILKRPASQLTLNPGVGPGSGEGGGMGDCSGTAGCFGGSDDYYVCLPEDAAKIAKLVNEWEASSTRTDWDKLRASGLKNCLVFGGHHSGKMIDAKTKTKEVLVEFYVKSDPLSVVRHPILSERTLIRDEE